MKAEELFEQTGPITLNVFSLCDAPDRFILNPDSRRLRSTTIHPSISDAVKFSLSEEGTPDNDWDLIECRKQLPAEYIHVDTEGKFSGWRQQQ
jgi:hypothetical protein